MKGWTELCSDMNWEDHHGMWGRKAPDGSWYVLQWTNMWDAAGESSGLPRYECAVKRLDPRDVPPASVESVLRSRGCRISRAALAPISIVSDFGDVVAATLDAVELCILETSIQYGLGAPLESFTGDKYPRRIRAAAARYALAVMRDADALRARLARPVNAIGSTAQEYGIGNLDAALARYQRGEGDPDTGKDIMLKMQGAAPRGTP